MKRSFLYNIEYQPWLKGVKEGNIGENMLHKTRCKFYVSARTVNSTQPFDGQSTCFSSIVKLNAAYSPDPSTENYSFWNATPSGVATLYLYGEDACEMYKPGSFWYIDLWEDEGGDWRTLNFEQYESNISVELGNNPGGMHGGNKIELNVTNKSAWRMFGEGKKYRAEFTPATKC